MRIGYAAGSLILAGLLPQAAVADNWAQIACAYTEDTGAFQLPEQFKFNMTRMVAYSGGGTSDPLVATNATLQWGERGSHYTLNRKTLRLQHDLGFAAQCRFDKSS